MRPPLVVATGLPGAGEAVAIAAAVAVAAASFELVGSRGGVVVAELDRDSARGPTVLASGAARRLEGALQAEGIAAAARGAVCWVNRPGGEGEPLAVLRELVRSLDGLAGAVVSCVPRELWRPVVEDPLLPLCGALLVAKLPEQRSLAALAVREVQARGARAKVVARPPGAVARRRATAGLDPGGATAVRARRIAAHLLGPRPARPLAGELYPGPELRAPTSSAA